MGDNWISKIIVNAVSAPVANAVAGAGNLAGGAVGGVGNAINGVGRGIESGIRYYGDGVIDYGNAVRDWTKASGPRQATASNPLGLSGSSTGGKLAFTGGKSKPQDKKAPIKAPRSNPFEQKALPASSGKRTQPSKALAARPSAAKTSTTKPAASSTLASKNQGGAVKKTISAQSRPERPKPRAGAPKTDYGHGSKAAANPLGL